MAATVIRPGARAPAASARIKHLEAEVAVLRGALGHVMTLVQRDLELDAKTVKRLGEFRARLYRHTRPAKGSTKVRAERNAKRKTPVEVKLSGQPASKRTPASTSGLGAALARGEGAKVSWVHAGEIVPAKKLAQRWDLTPQALGPAATRGEVFAIVVKHQRFYPKEFLELDRDDVSAVCKALAPLPVGEKLAFWKRPHGALGGRTVFELLSGKQAGGASLARAVALARARSAQAQANAAAAA